MRGGRKDPKSALLRSEWDSQEDFSGGLGQIDCIYDFRVCPWSPFRSRASSLHGLPIPTPSEDRTMPTALTHAFLWSVRSSVSTSTAATRRPRPNPASMPVQNLGPACDQSRQAAGGPKNDGRSDGLLVSCGWLAMRENQAPLLPDAGAIRGRISATSIWPSSTPSITTGTDCPGLKRMHEE